MREGVLSLILSFQLPLTIPPPPLRLFFFWPHPTTYIDLQMSKIYGLYKTTSKIVLVNIYQTLGFQ